MKEWFSKQSKPVKGFLVGALVIIILAVTSSVLKAEELGGTYLNRHIDQTNFIVGNHCSATLISNTPPLLITNYHCVDQYVRQETKKVVDENGEIANKTFESLKDVPVSQRTYKGFDIVSEQAYVSAIDSYDKDVDLALLKFKANEIPNNLRSTIFTGEILRGETVYAVGNPLGLDATLSKGIVSSVNRKLRVGGEDKAFIQMDAGIAPGNSGGALYNTEVQLIGVPAAAATGTMIGLAIPNTSIMSFLEENCWSSLFEEAPPHDECIKDKEDKEDKEE